jgi:hypothetical protein
MWSVSDSPAAVLSANLDRVFNERDAAARRAAIEELYDAGIVFHDPEASVTGIDGFDAQVTALLAPTPDWVFTQEGDAEEVADLGIVRWGLGAPGAEPTVRGKDIGIVRDGRIVTLYTILG